MGEVAHIVMVAHIVIKYVIDSGHPQHLLMEVKSLTINQVTYQQVMSPALTNENQLSYSLSIPISDIS